MAEVWGLEYWLMRLIAYVSGSKSVALALQTIDAALTLRGDSNRSAHPHLFHHLRLVGRLRSHFRGDQEAWEEARFAGLLILPTFLVGLPQAKVLR
ncbi:hypothetical protein Syun_018042 [Stephania yunnanensis]|uniref:Uncharacterized protein n=1 Tax=Stephania yunnanensis TaxID=152371 RepID=A0AAP0IS67_9MAGN